MTATLRQNTKLKLIRSRFHAARNADAMHNLLKSLSRELHLTSQPHNGSHWRSGRQATPAPVGLDRYMGFQEPHQVLDVKGSGDVTSCYLKRDVSKGYVSKARFRFGFGEVLEAKTALLSKQHQILAGAEWSDWELFIRDQVNTSSISDLRKTHSLENHLEQTK